ncbi:hypothetical protein [Streptomyces nitrosporeus]|uniref:hypothetical protein n=1 Tax=Streptomyces nitrosporeus TaxID=28894 RepID=UPI00332DE77E
MAGDEVHAPVPGAVAGSGEVVVGPGTVADQDRSLGRVQAEGLRAVVEPEEVALLHQEVGATGDVGGAVVVGVQGAVDVADGEDLVGVGPVVAGLVVHGQFLAFVQACLGAVVGLLVVRGAGPAHAVVRVDLEGLAPVSGDGGDEILEAVAGPVAPVGDVGLVVVAVTRDGACPDVPVSLARVEPQPAVAADAVEVGVVVPVEVACFAGDGQTVCVEEVGSPVRTVLGRVEAADVQALGSGRRRGEGQLGVDPAVAVETRAGQDAADGGVRDRAKRSV